ncbi:MAG: hypothetical protein DRP11_02610, partial [Candidatus Aenigmatarchaeota archaeon]
IEEDRETKLYRKIVEMLVEEGFVNFIADSAIKQHIISNSIFCQIAPVNGVIKPIKGYGVDKDDLKKISEEHKSNYVFLEYFDKDYTTLTPVRIIGNAEIDILKKTFSGKIDDKEMYEAIFGLLGIDEKDLEIDYLSFYQKSDPDSSKIFKDKFRFLSPDSREKVIEDILKIEEPNPDIDEWLSENYSDVIKKVGRMLIE